LVETIIIFVEDLYGRPDLYGDLYWWIYIGDLEKRAFIRILVP